MAVSLDTLMTETRRYLRAPDLEVLTNEDRKEIITNSLTEYSDRRPLNKVTALTGDSTAIYDLPSDYENGFAYLYEVEFPLDNIPKTIIDQKNWYLDDTPNGQKLRFNCNNPSINDEFWIKYTKRHTFDSDGNSQVPTADLTGLTYLCVVNINMVLSQYYANKANVNLTEAEPFSFNTRVAEYNSLADKFRKMYDREIKEEFTGFHGQVDFSQDMFYDRNEE